MKIKYRGMTATRKGLRIYVTLDYGNAVRFAEFLLPVTELDPEAMASALDRRVRNDLLSVWSAERGDSALF